MRCYATGTGTFQRLAEVLDSLIPETGEAPRRGRRVSELERYRRMVQVYPMIYSKTNTPYSMKWRTISTAYGTSRHRLVYQRKEYFGGRSDVIVDIETKLDSQILKAAIEQEVTIIPLDFSWVTKLNDDINSKTVSSERLGEDVGILTHAYNSRFISNQVKTFIKISCPYLHQARSR